MIHKKVITEAMNTIAEVLYKNLDHDYYLAGGTAIALHIGHRESIDLDYFIGKDFDTLDLKNKLLALFPHAEFTYEEVNTLWCIIDGVKCSFITRKSQLLDTILVEDNFRLASIPDLVVMKLQAICGREEYKDYFDLACLIRETDIRTWSSWWITVNSSSDTLSWITALAYVSNVIPIPLKTFTPLTSHDVEQLLLHGVKELSHFA
jgi:hypothetical protein